MTPKQSSMTPLILLEAHRQGFLGQAARQMGVAVEYVGDSIFSDPVKPKDQSHTHYDHLRTPKGRRRAR